jgi:hypothetical protein
MPEQRSEMISTRGSVPVPDPTVLTTQQLLREIFSVRELLEARLTGMDKAITLLQTGMDRSPSTTELYAKYEEKFKAIQIQFNERDTRVDQTARDSKLAIDAALQAAKEAVGKSEVGTTKQVDQIVVMINTLSKTLDGKIDDAKTRINLLESGSKGMEGHAQGTADLFGYIFGAAAFVYAVVMTVMVFYRK